MTCDFDSIAKDTLTAGGLGGDRQTILLSSRLTAFTAYDPPNLHVYDDCENPVPRILIAVPPSSEPMVGNIECILALKEP